jgi:hypothetical protein
MAYSLFHNKQLIYYRPTTTTTTSTTTTTTTKFDADAVSELLRRDQAQLKLDSQALLDSAECYKKTDRDYILGMLDENFDYNRADPINTVKSFVQRRMLRQETAATAAERDLELAASSNSNSNSNDDGNGKQTMGNGRARVGLALRKHISMGMGKRHSTDVEVTSNPMAPTFASTGAGTAISNRPKKGVVI